jgi:Phosphate-starvation-inducible E family
MEDDPTQAHAHPVPRTSLPGWMPVSLVWAERIVFFAVGVLLFVCALALAFRGVQVLFGLLAGSVGDTVALTAQFLDIVLLILMIVEIAYTVSLSLRGAILSAHPFLIVGLIAVIRRVLVLTVREVGSRTSSDGWISRPTVELVVLAFVVMVFVFAIYLLGKRGTAGD